MAYLEQFGTKFLKYVNNIIMLNILLWTKNTSLVFKKVTFWTFLSLAISFFLLSSNFIVPCVKTSR